MRGDLEYKVFPRKQNDANEKRLLLMIYRIPNYICLQVDNFLPPTHTHHTHIFSIGN